jgi:hypothetical protein
MPLDTSIFPEEVQVAFFIFGLLPDRWDGMSGYYMGKDWSSANFMFSTYEIEDVKTTVYFAKMYEAILIEHRAEESNKRRKESERRSRSGSNAHTVTG